MIQGIPKISVGIITYNQEKLIRRAIESVLSQRDYIHEICICDDCSQDGTWAVAQEYASRYPGLFVLWRNEKNLGLFENIEVARTLSTGDLDYGLAGDDEAGEGWFKTVVEFILKNKIDYKNERFCIYGDYEARYPNGDSYVHRNKLIASGVPPLRLALRGLVGNRSSCRSVNVTHQYKKVSQGRSHIAEDAMDRQLQVFSEKNYYIPKVGNIYYASIGVSAHMSDETMRERAMIRPYAIQLFESWGVQFSKKDKIYSLEYFPAFEKMVHNPTLGSILQAVYLRIKSWDRTIKPNTVELRSIIFAIRRRLPHKKPIHM